MKAMLISYILKDPVSEHAKLNVYDDFYLLMTVEILFNSRVLNQALYFLGLETSLIPLLFLPTVPKETPTHVAVLPSLYHPAKPWVLKRGNIILGDMGSWGRGMAKTLGVNRDLWLLLRTTALTVYLCIKIDAEGG